MTELTDGGRRKAAYDAVYAYIRDLPGDPHSYESVCRNASIWRAVHAALDAAEAPSDADGEAERLARAWEEKYFEMVEKYTAVAQAQASDADGALMRTTLRLFRMVHDKQASGHEFGSLPDCPMCDHVTVIRRRLGIEVGR